MDFNEIDSVISDMYGVLQAMENEESCDPSEEVLDFAGWRKRLDLLQDTSDGLEDDFTGKEGWELSFDEQGRATKFLDLVRKSVMDLDVFRHKAY